MRITVEIERDGKTFACERHISDDPCPGDPLTTYFNVRRVLYACQEDVSNRLFREMEGANGKT